ncbi:ComEC/Rec2 family competence protein [bacterium]|nr:ComEC/Rec2 family competence protein [bacterium]
MNEKYTFSWERFPALFILASLIAGALLSKGIFFPLLLACTHKKKHFIAASLCLSLFTGTLFHLAKKSSPESSEVVALLHPSSLKKKRGRLSLTASVPYLINKEGKEFERLKVYLPLSSKNTPDLNYEYIVTGPLKKSPYGYFLRPKTWKKGNYAPSLIQTRFSLHERAKKTIKKRVQDSDVQNYFIALVTGNIPSDFLRAKFMECGLIHILAISGFHFSWIIFLLSVPISLVCSRKTSLLCLLLFAWIYFLFAGSSTSISRAWIATTIYLLSILFSRVSLPLNALGLAGICSILIDPYSIFQISFALSFLATFAVLTLYPLAKVATHYFYPKEEGHLPLWRRSIFSFNQFCILSFFITLFIQAAILPISLFFFPFIPLFGLYYNLFFPISMMPTLILLILSFLTEALMPATYLWRAAEAITKPFLEMVLYGKGPLFLLLKSPPLSPHILALSTLFILFLCLKSDAYSHEKYLLKQDGVHD